MTTQPSHELEPNDPFIVPDDTQSIPRGVKASMAFELRKAGASYELIAEKLGYANHSTAEGAVRKVIADKYKPDDVETVVQMELARLDALQLVAWRRAKEGDLSAINQILKIMERRSNYLGLDKQAPTVQGGDVTNNTAIFIGGSEEEYVEQLQQARERAMKMVKQSQREIESGS